MLRQLIQMEGDGPTSWRSAVREDIYWLWRRAKKTENMPEPDTDWAAWEEYAARSEAWKAAVRQAFEEVEAGRAPLHDIPNEDMQQVAQVDALESVCQLCDARFTTRKACITHATTKHGAAAVERQWLNIEGRCDACGRNFHNSLRLQRHLAQGAKSRYGVSCLHQMHIAQHTESSIEEQEEVANQQRELHKNARRTGVPPTFADRYVEEGVAKLVDLYLGPVDKKFVVNACYRQELPGA
eukprot:TRINITY_DN6042_c0_g1_i6.p1 TRINITY_DN6042_c0_g1~~TRINITY_DN6042_c0_g1_i6.p1  ORF type:complete len:240 (+),score=55.77 TRINITY_DN6042_c0_g1_i6:360-1079(+)